MTGPVAGTASSTGLSPNVAAALSYLLGFITGIIFYVLEKENQYVRFHAMQSIVVFGTLFVLRIAISIIGIIPLFGWIVWILGFLVLGIIGLVLWIVLMIKAFQGQEWEVPILGKYARQYSSGASAI